MNEHVAYGILRKPERQWSGLLPDGDWSGILERVLRLSERNKHHIDGHMAFFTYQLENPLG